MRHEAAMRRLDELDAGQGYGLALRLHLSRCRSCAAAARRMADALSAYREEAPEPESTRRLEELVMEAVSLLPPPRQDFALRDWLFPGAVLAFSMVLIPLLGKDLGFLESLFGPSYALSLSLVLGIAFTAYCGLFIATHLEEVQSYLQKRGLMPR
jgi:hypothetical protein